MPTTEIMFPSIADLRPLVEALLGKDVTMEKAATVIDPTTNPELLTVYVGSDDTPLMLAGGDPTFAYYAGAALALIPKGRADDCIAGAEDEAGLLENYWEIINVATRAVNDAEGPHVRMIPGTQADLASLPTPGIGLSLTTEIDGYGTGLLSFWML